MSRNNSQKEGLWTLAAISTFLGGIAAGCYNEAHTKYPNHTITTSEILGGASAALIFFLRGNYVSGRRTRQERYQLPIDHSQYPSSNA
jgi:hypothetical protein